MDLINSALFCEDLVSWMLERQPERFGVYEITQAKSITFGSHAGCSSGNGPGCSAVLQTGKNVVNAKHTVLCTNGYGDLEM